MKTTFLRLTLYLNSSRVFLLFSFLLALQVCSFAQTNGDLSNIRVEELTEDQVRKFVNELNRLGITDEQVEQIALQKGMNPIELVKLKDRVQAARKVLSSSGSKSVQQFNQTDPSSRLEDSISNLEKRSVADYNSLFADLQTRNFGFEVFNNPRLTFEPNLRLPTPRNYQLAPDDELLIDVSGYSEASYKLKVSPEGNIRIPLAGPVHVNGQTIEQAKRNIIRKLTSTIYADIATGRTSVEVTLGSIRSIRITIIGEATMPGTYTLPSLATAYNALYACGGPNSNGSFRNIQVIRNNATVSTIDVYQYLINGNKRNDVRLMDMDVIKINTYSTRIELKGEVKKPGLYDVATGETLGKILEYAGGFTDNAYTARIQVFTNTSRDRKVSTIAENSINGVIPGKGDTYIVGKILNRFENRISIKGAIYRPGEYELKTGMTLKQLINESDGIREDAFTGRGIIHRLKADLSPEIVSFDIEKLMNGQLPDIELRREDRVNIFSKFDLKEGYYVTIEGEVSNPGIFLYEEGMTIQDLVLMSGGLKESASKKRVEVSRRIKGADTIKADTKTAVIQLLNFDQNSADSLSSAKFTLQPFDEISIRPEPGYFVQKNVIIEGEVLYTGKYTLEAKNDRISDLVKRAGGLTSSAYLNGAVLVRTRNFTRSEQANYEQGIVNLLKANYRAGETPELLQYQMDVIQKKSDLVGINLAEILDNPHSELDLYLKDGDTLRIPRQQQTVRVSGEVLYPALVRFDEQLNFKDYIIGAGGFGERSSKKRSYVVYSNGSVRGTKSFLFFKNYPSISPGAEIFVPTKREKERLRPMEAITIGATLVTMLAILVGAID